MPTNKNLANLSTAINSISTGGSGKTYYNHSLMLYDISNSNIFTRLNIITSSSTMMTSASQLTVIPGYYTCIHVTLEGGAAYYPGFITTVSGSGISISYFMNGSTSSITYAGSSIVIYDTVTEI